MKNMEWLKLTRKREETKLEIDIFSKRRDGMKRTENGQTEQEGEKMQSCVIWMVYLGICFVSVLTELMLIIDLITETDRQQISCWRAAMEFNSILSTSVVLPSNQCTDTSAHEDLQHPCTLS